jgi:hypothetical protein
MLTIIEAAELLNLCPICSDIQNKILMLFIGINGTYTSNIMKSQIKYSDTSFNGSLVERIILENDNNTLWRLKVFLNKGITFNRLYIKNLRVSYELKIAYLSEGINDLQRFYNISSLLGSIETNSNSDLFGMFYNLDKNNYGYLGTPTANIIHNAITNKIINEFDPIIWYEVDLDLDAKYY